MTELYLTVVNVFAADDQGDVDFDKLIGIAEFVFDSMETMAKSFEETWEGFASGLEIAKHPDMPLLIIRLVWQEIDTKRIYKREVVGRARILDLDWVVKEPFSFFRDTKVAEMILSDSKEKDTPKDSIH